MKARILLFAGIAAALLIVAGYPRESTGAAAPEESSPKVKELQKERIATLKSLVEVSTKLYQNARVEVGESIEARLLLLGAEIEAAEKPDDRIKLYEAAIAGLTDLEKIAQAQLEAGRASQLPLMKLKAKRLELAIALERTKAAK
jgi:hypothetical protein